ncbi:MAG: aminotransferase class IV family protein [Chitinophagaceae bacterium]|nr:aminotransferase class IV family protein [Chitinophagaceae bacterium]MBP9739706.1 aminotransferase class IV family protein [Chitinophagaceae bacterium]
MQQPKLNFNGTILNANKPIIEANNRSFRYGDGCFETMKAVKGKIIHATEHFERFFQTLELLQFDKISYLTPAYLHNQINELLQKNQHQQLARIRLTLFRGNGGLYDAENHFPNYIIQTWDLNSANNQLNENGLVIDVFKDAKKTFDSYSHIKSNNYLPYLMAALWAKKNHLNDALLLNPFNRIADATIANIFIVQNGIVKTPTFTEGGVNGIMKNYLLQCLKNENIPFEETLLTTEDLHLAQEVFLTNSIYGIKWVKQCGNTNYTMQLSGLLHNQFIKKLWQ